MEGEALTPARKMLVFSFVICKPAVHSQVAAEFPVDEVVTMLAFGNFSVGEASPFHRESGKIKNASVVLQSLGPPE